LRAALAASLVLAGCGSAPEREPAIGQAFAGPAKLSLRKEIDPKSPVVATVPHGAKLDILQQRRRWYRVRVSSGAEGWTDDRDLLDTAQMNRILALNKETEGLPSQGAGTTFDVLNVHTEPNRLSTSFVQVKQGEKFDVIAHRVIARTPLPRRELIVPRPRAEPPKKKSKIPLPAPPKPPSPPVDWVALSKERARIPEEDLPPVARDDWTLIRTHDGQSGWVLTSRVYMGIPDEVAQYAEGHRITSYFSIGKVRDGDVTKDIWLWTTSVGLGEDHDFDGYRVFTWSLRHHRYETAYIQRRVTGFFPTLARQAAFSVCLEDENGGRIRKEYVMQQNLVHLSGQKPCEKSFQGEEGGDLSAHINVHEAPPKRGLFARAKAKISGFFGK
jgi:hypothetical protein